MQQPMAAPCLPLGGATPLRTPNLRPYAISRPLADTLGPVDIARFHNLAKGRQSMPRTRRPGVAQSPSRARVLVGTCFVLLTLQTRANRTLATRVSTDWGDVTCTDGLCHSLHHLQIRGGLVILGEEYAQHHLYHAHTVCLDSSHAQKITVQLHTRLEICFFSAEQFHKNNTLHTRRYRDRETPRDRQS